MWANVDWKGSPEVPDIPPSVSQGHEKQIKYVPFNKKKPFLKRKATILSAFKALQSEESCGYSADDVRLTINVSGLIFETRASTLARFPETLLGSANSREKFFDHIRHEYFFDRCRLSFHAILYFYQSGGHLIRPTTVPEDVFIKEIFFYRINYSSADFLDQVSGNKKPSDISFPRGSIQKRIRLCVEYPESSRLARFFEILSLFLIISSTASFCLETLPMFTTYRLDFESSNYKMPIIEPDTQDLIGPFFIFESFAMVWFTFEIFLRFIAAKSKIEYVKSALNIIDILSVIPYYVSLVTMLFDFEAFARTTSFKFLKMVRLVRVFRVLKLTRYSKGLQILSQTIVESSRELSLLLFFLAICVILFASLVYYAENEVGPSSFTSIPDSFWWAVVTMTTVGYGDMHPQTAMGKFIGCICAVAGVLTIALPVPVIVSNFNYFYSKQKDNDFIYEHLSQNSSRLSLQTKKDNIPVESNLPESHPTLFKESNLSETQSEQSPATVYDSTENEIESNPLGNIDSLKKSKHQSI